jgi:hypothetical protein
VRGDVGTPLCIFRSIGKPGLPYLSSLFERFVVLLIPDLPLAMRWLALAELGLFMLGVLGPISCLPYA